MAAEPDRRLTSEESDFLNRVDTHMGLRPADRSQDKLRQRLRRDGFVFFDRSTGHWELTPTGRAALARSEEK
jgi:hypothetical protein